MVSKNSNYLEFLDDDDEEVENKSLYTKTVIAHGKLYKRESDNVLYGSSADTFSPYIDRQSFRPESNELQSEDSQDYESNLSSDISDDEYDDETYQSIIINDKNIVQNLKNILMNQKPNQFQKHLNHKLLQKKHLDFHLKLKKSHRRHIQNPVLMTNI